ncbi:lethal giant larvae like, C-terminal-domain-containing protein [Cubamyces menziesii]|nr:lethal giant larvae like, C-terminal-domain-containing protein [Cubamyces menziesii]
MFTSQTVKSLPDLSLDISDASDWEAILLRSIPHHVDITAVATDPVSGLLAIGTAHGSIYVYGSPGVESRLKITEPTGLKIKFMQFAVSVFKLLCIDEHDRLHVWDCASLGKPKLQRITGFGQAVHAIITSPSHTHAFIALADGEIKTYDLLCLRISQYSIPNQWRLYEKRSLASGLELAGALSSDLIIDTVIHPRNLNLLFVLFEGGVLVSDLAAQNTVRAFELILPPGAPGGTGFHAKDILLPRRLQATALAIHPSGHLLAVGYADGTIGFWALEDEDRPLALRTLDSTGEEDLSTVDTAKLDSVLSSPQDHPVEPPREPIFKLAWSGSPNSSDPRGGDTILSVLGGMTIDSPPGLTALLLPPLQPPAPPDAGSPKPAGAAPLLHSQTRAVMVQTIVVKDVYTYTTVGPVQDFHLFPRSTPHFGGHYDPSTILIVSDSDVPEARTSEAFEFPPPTFLCTPDSPATQRQSATEPSRGDDVNAEEALAEELAMALQSMEVSDEPRVASLPPQLWDVVGEHLLKVDKHAYDTIVRDKLASVDGEVSFPVKGGMAWSEDPEGQMKYIKHQPHRILVTYLRDLSVRFLDISPQLLVSTGEDNPLASSFPSVLSRLRVDLAPLFIDHSLGLSLIPPTSAEYDPRLSKERIESVQVAPESLECVTAMRSGAVILHRLDVQQQEGGFGQRSFEDEELVSLAYMRPRRGLRYSPVFAVKPHKDRGLVTACALADAGFLAIAYASGSLLVVDLRGPRVILRHDASRRNSSGFLHKHADVEPFVSLSWACCGLASESGAQLRLFASASSGDTSVYTLAYEAPSIWAVKQAAIAVEVPGRPIPGSCFVLDAKTGTRCHADRQGLATVLRPGSAGDDKKYVWVAVGSKGVRCTLNVNGERIAKAEWGSKVGTIQRAEVVAKTDSCALVAFTSLGNALIYSLPHLEHIHTTQLPASGSSDPPNTDDTGDFVTHTTFPAPAGSPVRPHLSTQIQTLFSHRRAGPYALPLVDLAYGRGSVPPQPQPISLGPPSMIGSMLGYIGSLAGANAGDQIDALLAGPDRPVPQPSKPSARSGTERPATGTSAAGSSSQTSISAAAAGMSSGVADLYNRLGSALAERGEMLGDLQQSMDSLEQGSKSMVEQAKRLAAQQGMKSWFGF